VITPHKTTRDVPRSESEAEVIAGGGGHAANEDRGVLLNNHAVVRVPLAGLDVVKEKVGLLNLGAKIVLLNNGALHVEYRQDSALEVNLAKLVRSI